MGFRDRLKAKARGDVSTAALYAYASSNGDAYGLVDTLPATGVARLAAWCAFVLQTHADNLLRSGRSSGYASPEAFELARLHYEFVGPWLARARAASMSDSYRLDVVVPQGLPNRASAEPQLVRAARRTLETVQARAGVELEARRGEPVYERLAPTMASLQSAIDSSAALSAPDVDLSVVAVVADTLHDALDRAYELGQLLALPELMSRPAPEPPGTAPLTAATLQLFRPGERGFDPWCLTDPVERRERQAHARFMAELDALWKDDPEPERTLAIQSDIATAIQRGLADYMPPGGTTASIVRRRCPWPGVLYAKAPLVIGGREIAAGDCFAFTVGMSDKGFQRAIVTFANGVRLALGGVDDASDGLSRFLDRLAGGGANVHLS